MRGSEESQWVGVVLLNARSGDGRTIEGGVPQLVATVDLLFLITAYEIEMARGDSTRPFAIPPLYDHQQTG